MRHLDALSLLGIAAPLIANAADSIPRGVGPEFVKYYQNPDAFACIAHPSIIIKPAYVNDDYCHCPDGSDEPGTAACTHLSPLSPPQPLPGSPSGTTNTTNALPGFYCENKGHLPTYADFRIINDGVCDYEVCCDGSDEWAGVGGVKCENRCDVMGKEYRRKAEALEKSAVAARKKRAALVTEAGRLRAAVSEKMKSLEREIVALKQKEAEAKIRLEETETREKGRVVASGKGKGSKMSVLVGLAKARIEELRDALAVTMVKRDEARLKVSELEAILSTFKEEYNPNFNDEGVKRAVKAWEDYAAGKDGNEDNAAQERDLETVAAPDSEETGINWTDWQEEEESDVDALYRFEEYLPLSARAWLREKIDSVRAFLITSGVLLDKSTPRNGESRAVANARSAWQTLADSLSNKEKEVGESSIELGRDFGPDDVFRALKGTCVSQDSGEYTYELCWMDKTTQKSKKGGGHTGMGNFVRFDKTIVDDEVGADGKGLGSGERLTLVYENGQHCWNGPNRATEVVVACAERDEIWRVSELEKCIYRMEVGSPAGCEKEMKAAGFDDRKEEL